MNNSYHVLENEFGVYLQTLGFSKSVVYSYPKMVHFFLDYLHQKGINQITALDTTHLNNYTAYLQSRRNMRKAGALSTAHLNKSFDALDKFLEFLHSQGCKNTPTPTRYRITALNEVVPKVLTPQQIQQVYESCNCLFDQMTFDQASARRALATLILDLCYGCGLRKSEAFKLLLSDVDLDKKLLFVRQAKGYKDRYIPINDIIAKRLTVFIYEYRRVFKTTHKRLFPLSAESMVHYITLLRKTSGIYFGLHTLRHSIATHLLQNGMNVGQIAQFLGHSSLESTQIYTHILNDNI